MSQQQSESKPEGWSVSADMTDVEPCRPSKSDLSGVVVKWYTNHGRRFPWRDSRNLFHLLVAEVLLRQTQAERVAGPYGELVGRYPTPEALAKADVCRLRDWFRPLGLARRATWLVEIARLVTVKWSGRVPSDLENLLALPGIGPYGARAILCLGLGTPLPMVDGGSGRVLRRTLGVPAHGPAHRDAGLLRLAEEYLPSGMAKEFNLGLIDIAAACCHPRAPSCVHCPLSIVCCAVSEGRC